MHNSQSWSIKTKQTVCDVTQALKDTYKVNRLEFAWHNVKTDFLSKAFNCPVLPLQLAFSFSDDLLEILSLSSLLIWF